MLKLILVFLLMTGTTLTVGCSSKSSESTEQAVDAPQDGEEVVEEVEEIVDGDDQYEVVEEDAGAMTADNGDSFTSDTGGGLPDEVTTTEVADEAVMEPESTTTMEEAGADQSMMSDSTESMDAPMTAEPPTFAQESTPTMADEGEYSDGASPMAADSSEKTYVPVKKIATTPWSKAGFNVNSVYLARPGDTMDSIAEKIYGSASKADELYSINPNLRRGVKVGDKVYYNSPLRPDDREKILTFYEDNGVPAQSYTARDGENIRAIAKTLLGHERSWMEVWATNSDVESKGELTGGTTLRYWPTDVSMGGPSMGSSEAVPAAEPEAAISEVEPDMPSMDEPTLPDEVATDLPPPPAEPIQTGEPTNVADLGMNQGSESMDMPPPPPPPIEPMGTPSLPDEAIAPPPPPPPSKPPTPVKKRAKAQGGGLDAFLADEFNLMLAAGVLFIAVAGALIIIRKRRQSRRINLGETQV